MLNLQFARPGIFHVHIGEQQVALAVPLETGTSDGGPWQQPVTTRTTCCSPVQALMRATGRAEMWKCARYANHNVRGVFC